MANQNEINKSLFEFFKQDIPQNGDQKKLIEEMNSKLSTILDTLAFLHDVIPSGQAVVVKFVHGKVILANRLDKSDPRRVTQLIITKPQGVLELSANTEG